MSVFAYTNNRMPKLSRGRYTWVARRLAARYLFWPCGVDEMACESGLNDEGSG